MPKHSIYSTNATELLQAGAVHVITKQNSKNCSNQNPGSYYFLPFGKIGESGKKQNKAKQNKKNIKGICHRDEYSAPSPPTKPNPPSLLIQYSLQRPLSLSLNSLSKTQTHKKQKQKLRLISLSHRMWQVLLAAAVAGSTSLVAKHLFNPNADPTTTTADQPHNLNAQACTLPSDCDFEEQERDGIFRFSSSGSRSRPSSSRKKPGSRKLVGAAKKGGDRSGRVGKEKGEAAKEIQRKSSARKFAVSLKRRKTNKNVSNKAGSSSSNSKESSLFGWGLGVGIMYMMSAGKTEISKLNMAVDETAKVVQELKTELYKRKSSHHLHISGPARNADAKSRKNNSKHTQLALNKFNTQNVDPNDFKISGVPVIDDGEYASSVLTEEPEPRLLEMDELEAEFESELQKLPWCIMEASQQEEMRPILGEDHETEVSDMELHEVEGQNLHSNQFDGVVPAELDQKLCHLLIEQQENQIVELESELHSAQSKLNSKEAELQALKDCVRRLTNFSLSNVSDDETEAHEEQKHTSEWDYKNQTESESNKSMVGMKRPMDSALCGHYVR